ncbi:hypothetical protein FGG78_18240, partial [Thioclava sp. BHET1]
MDHGAAFDLACARARTTPHAASRTGVARPEHLTATSRAAPTGSAPSDTTSAVAKDTEADTCASPVGATLDQILQRTKPMGKAACAGDSAPVRVAPNARTPQPAARPGPAPHTDAAQAAAGLQTARRHAEALRLVAGGDRAESKAAQEAATGDHAVALKPLRAPGKDKDKDHDKAQAPGQPLVCAVAFQPPSHDIARKHHQTGATEARAAAGSASGSAPAISPAMPAAAGAFAASGTAPVFGDAQPQLLQSTGDLAAAGGGSARITLHPETLGTVVVRVDVTAHGVTNVHMTASSEDGRQALAAQIGQLAQHLAQSGLSVGLVQIAQA